MAEAERYTAEWYEKQRRKGVQIRGLARAIASTTLDSLLKLYWPVERPDDQALGEEVERGIAEGLLYAEDIGHGWRRIGLTKRGQEAKEALQAVRP